MKIRTRSMAGLLLSFAGSVFAQSGATLLGTVQFAYSTSSQEKRPFNGASVRACSLDRVLQTETDETGSFRFTEVPPGIYDVMAAGGAWMPRIVKGVTLKSGQEEVVEMDVAADNAPAIPACFRYDAQDCSITKAYFDYEAPQQRQSGLIRGVVTAPTSGHKRRGVSAAKIALFSAGGKVPLHSETADKKGQFTFNTQPGIYELVVTRQGFQDVQVKPFLAPRENITSVTIQTAKVGWIEPCVDEAFRAAGQHAPPLGDSPSVAGGRQVTMLSPIDIAATSIAEAHRD